jgi:hypothetical protein
MGTRPVADTRAGAALPGVLLVMFWLTGVSGWLVAHTVWDQRVATVDEATLALGQSADAMADVMTRVLGATPDWATAIAPGPDMPCPAGGPPLPPAVDALAETALVQAATDAVSRWDAASTPVWRYRTACEAAALQAIWRWRVAAPWLLAWVADDPDAIPGPGGPTQVMLHVLAVQPGGGRAARTVTLRRYPGETWARVVAWRAD